MKSKSLAHKGLQKMFQDVGVLHVVVVDNSKEQVKGDFKQKATEHGVVLKATEPYSPWQQAAESAIHEVK